MFPYCNAYEQTVNRFQSPLQVFSSPIEYLRINRFESTPIDLDPITDEEFADIEISLDELQRGDYVTIPADATKEDIRRILLSM